MNDQEQDIKINSLEQNHKFMAEKLEDLKQTVLKGFNKVYDKMDAHNKECDKRYVSKDKFEPIKLIVYGLVSFILLAFVGGLSVLVMK